MQVNEINTKIGKFSLTESYLHLIKQEVQYFTNKNLKKKSTRLL